MGWYIELHCDTVTPSGGCPFGASEEGPQGRSVKAVSAQARRAGWKQVDGRWRCPDCLKDMGYRVNVSLTPTEAGLDALALVTGRKEED